MPLNSVTYLTTQGWGGTGVPLDGAGGKGLKKPLAIPTKRGLKGLGKERDRAVEWWDCLFEASAKTLKFGTDTPNTPVSGSGTSTPVTAPLMEEEEHKINIPTPPSSSVASSSRLSMASMAKREHARRMLMSGFVRGRPELHNKPKKQEESTPTPPAKVEEVSPRQQEKKRKQDNDDADDKSKDAKRKKSKKDRSESDSEARKAEKAKSKEEARSAKKQEKARLKEEARAAKQVEKTRLKEEARRVRKEEKKAAKLKENGDVGSKKRKSREGDQDKKKEKSSKKSKSRSDGESKDKDRKRKGDE